MTTTPNEAQRQNWDGHGGEFWVANADRYDRGVAAYQQALHEAVDARPGRRILDVGCGNGTLTRELAHRSGSALGVDLSGPMLDLARSRAAAHGVDAVEFRQADAQVHPFSPDFDVVVSRHGTMFFDDPGAAFANLAAALRPGGRFVQLVWQPLERQGWLPRFAAALRFDPPGPDGPGPVSLGDPDTVRGLLAGAGFRGVELVGIERPMWFGDDADDATAFIAGQFGGALNRLEPGERAAAHADLRAVMAAHATSGGVLFPSACWLVTAVRPGRR